MSHDHPQTVLARVRADIAAQEEAIAAIRRQMAPHEAKIETLREFESYILSSFPAASVTEQPPPDPDPLDLDVTLASIPTHVIDLKAAEMLQGLRLGETVKARDIATFIAPWYDSDDDNRNFENRVFSVLRRRPERYVKVGRGNWALKEVVDAHPDLFGKKEDEPESAIEAALREFDEVVGK